MNKSIATNLIALILVIVGFVSPVYGELILMTGLFALSGAITNWLAVHMLFEKVPLLYGSGVIPNRFEEFKAGIKQLMVQEFFTREHIERFMSQNSSATLSALTDKIDYDNVYEQLTDAIVESPMGSMLSMVGGKQALEPIKEPVIEKLQGIVADIATTGQTSDGQTGTGQTGTGNDDLTATLLNQVEQIIDNRLAELTPEMVKEIVQTMIRKHLGWLVVWGGVFGGLIGFVVSLLS